MGTISGRNDLTRESYGLADIAVKERDRLRQEGGGFARIGGKELAAHRPDPVEREPETFEELFGGIQDELFDLMVRKQRDYGVGNISKFGLFGVLVRTSDKLERLLNLLEKGVDPSNESFEDTAKDIANYGMIMLAIMRGQWGLPLKEDANPLDDEEPEQLREY